MTRKSTDNNQFARTSAVDGTRTIAVGITPDEGIEPLADNNGRIITRLALDNGFVDALNPLPVSATLTIPDPLNVNVVSPDPLPVSITEPLRIFAPAGLPGDGPTYVPSVGRIYSSGGAKAIKSIYGYHDNPVPCYLQIFDRATLPLSGITIPTIVMPMGAGPGTLIPEVLSNPECYNSLSNGGFGNGIVLALSSTRAIFTALGTAYLNAYVLISF